MKSVIFYYGFLFSKGKDFHNLKMIILNLEFYFFIIKFKLFEDIIFQFVSSH